MKAPYTDPKKAVAHFEPMRTTADCYPAGVLSTLKEAKARMKFKGKLWSYRRVCELLGCIDGGPTFHRDGLIEDLREALREYHLDLEVSTAGAGSDYKYLASVCEDPRAGFPLVSLHHGFLTQKYPDHFQGSGTDEHVVIVLTVDTARLLVTYADPILPILEEAQDMTEAIREMSVLDLNRFWKPTYEPNWLLAVRQPTQRTLGEFEG